MKVNGQGSPIARVMFVSDAVTEYESRIGRPLLGSAGDEFDAWLYRTCRLQREDVFVTVLQREFTKKDRDATADEIADLSNEIAGVQPDVIVPFGAETTRLLLGEWATMELTYGLPHQTDRGYTVLPIPHPGGVQYELMAWGFEQLGKFLAGELTHHEIAAPATRYGAFSDSDAVFLPEFLLNDVVGIDTEGSPEAPWCLTFSSTEGQAGLIRAGQHQILATFVECLHKQQPTVVLHYAPHDLRVLAAMGVHLPPDVRVLDTMQLAYIAGRLPQGLKALAYRLCGMRMREYADLIREHDDRVAREWLTHELWLTHPEWAAALAQKAQKSDSPEVKALRRHLRALEKFPTAVSADTLHARWERSVLAERLGIRESMPHATLDDVPFEEVLQYACTDADATRRVFFKLREYFD